MPTDWNAIYQEAATKDPELAKNLVSEGLVSPPKEDIPGKESSGAPKNTPGKGGAKDLQDQRLTTQGGRLIGGITHALWNAPGNAAKMLWDLPGQAAIAGIEEAKYRQNHPFDIQDAPLFSVGRGMGSTLNSWVKGAYNLPGDVDNLAHGYNHTKLTDWGDPFADPNHPLSHLGGGILPYAAAPEFLPTKGLGIAADLATGSIADPGQGTPQQRADMRAANVGLPLATHAIGHVTGRILFPTKEAPPIENRYRVWVEDGPKEATPPLLTTREETPTQGETSAVPGGNPPMIGPRTTTYRNEGVGRQDNVGPMSFVTVGRPVSDTQLPEPPALSGDTVPQTPTMPQIEENQRTLKGKLEQVAQEAQGVDSNIETPIADEVAAQTSAKMGEVINRVAAFVDQIKRQQALAQEAMASGHVEVANQAIQAAQQLKAELQATLDQQSQAQVQTAQQATQAARSLLDQQSQAQVQTAQQALQAAHGMQNAQLDGISDYVNKVAEFANNLKNQHTEVLNATKQRTIENFLNADSIARRASELLPHDDPHLQHALSQYQSLKADLYKQGITDSDIAHYLADKAAQEGHAPPKP